jgi:2-polyprenyl-6-methoxyphenol hydroxylase-like FAD-dependent oxidoreductase
MKMTAHKTDVAIVGGGLAGSLAAAMLGRAGIDCALVDPNDVYPADFRCEKFDGPQVALLRKTGLADAILRAMTFDGGCWIARYGRVIEKRPGDQQGIAYTDLVNAVRREVPPSVSFVPAKARAIATTTDRQVVSLENGDTIDARLVVLANGLSVSVRDSLGLKREIVSQCHSIAIGFTVTPPAGRRFAFPAMTCYTDTAAARAALITLFPIGSSMRTNLFVYRQFDDPWLRQMRADPKATLLALMPKLRRLIGEFTVTGRVEIRPIDLYVTHGHRQPGVVLVGDAFATSCPAAGTGARKVLNDVERLCNHHLPQWLKTPGMDEAKIAAFYDDPVKRECDEFAAEKADSLKAMSLDDTLAGHIHRAARFVVQAGRGAAWAVLRAAGRDAAATGPVEQGAESALA